MPRVTITVEPGGPNGKKILHAVDTHSGRKIPLGVQAGPGQDAIDASIRKVKTQFESKGYEVHVKVM